MTTTKKLTAAELDAVEFGRGQKQGGARQALRCARSVNLSLKKEEVDKDGKLSRIAFSKVGDIGHADTIRLNHKAWDLFATANGLPLSDDLKPGQEVEFDTAALDVPWEERNDDGIMISNFPTAAAGSDYRVGDKAPAYAQEAAKAGTTKGMAIRVGSNTAALTAAIKADPKVAKAARLALVEKNAEAVVKAGQKAEFTAVEHGHAPMTSKSDIENIGANELAQADNMVEEGERRDHVWHLEAEAKAIYERFQTMSQKFGHTGVADEVAKLHNAAHYLTETLFGLNEFIVETGNVNKEVSK